jgi:solute carrier family 35, member E1
MQTLRGVFSPSRSNRGYSLLHSSPRFDPQSAKFAIPSRSTILFILSCLAWYLASALANNTAKAILSPPKRSLGSASGQHADLLLEAPTAGSVVQDQLPGNPQQAAVAPFPYPVTLTFIQFLFVHGLSLLCTSERLLGRRRLSKAVPPTKERVLEVGQLSVFVVVGHALSSLAISRVPVSTVHTVKVRFGTVVA